MMHAPAVVAVSLKMYLDPQRTLAWALDVARLARDHPAVTSGDVQLIVLPSVVALTGVVAALEGTRVAVGAQDLFYEDRGPYTGAVSGADLAQVGCSYVAVGHYERRRLFGEDDRVVELKVRAAWRNGLVPLLCVGETTLGSTPVAAAECVGQLDAALGGSAAGGLGDQPHALVVAYEPTWAIGGDEPARPEHIGAVIAALRDYLSAHPTVADAPIIYGGSAGLGLLPELAGAANGLFLGRFAHDASAMRPLLDEILQPQ